MLNITDGTFGKIGMHVVNLEINSESLPMSPTLVNIFAAPTQNIKCDPGVESKGRGSGSEKEDFWGKGSSQQSRDYRREPKNRGKAKMVFLEKFQRLWRI